MLKYTGRSGFSLVELLITVAIVGLVVSAVASVYQVSQESYTRARSLEAAQLGARAGLDRMANELRLIGSYWVGANGAGNAITAATANTITFMANVDNVDALSANNGFEVRVSATAAGTSVPLNLSASDTRNAFKVYQNSALNDFIYIAEGGVRDVRQISAINGSTLTVAPALSSSYPVPPGTNLQNVLVRDVKTITYTRNTGNNTLTRTQGGDPTPDPIVDNVTGLTFTYFDAAGGALSASPSNPGLIREIQIDLTIQDPGGGTRYMTTRVKPRSLP